MRIHHWASYRPIISRTYTRILIRSFRITYDWTIHSLGKQPAFGDTTTGFPEKWRLRNERRNSMVTTRRYLDLGSASDWLKQISHAARPIKALPRVTRHHYGISARFFWSSFRIETSEGVAKCRLFSKDWPLRTKNWKTLRELSHWGSREVF